MKPSHWVVAFLLIGSPVVAQTTADPLPESLEAIAPVVRVGYQEFASLPDVDGEIARPTILVDEPDTERLFVSDMWGTIYTISYDGETVTRYVDLEDPAWGGIRVQSQGRERGLQSFAVHPQFGEVGAPGYGKFYTWTDVTDTSPMADFGPEGDQDAHDTLLLEWTAANPNAATYDGGAPRPLIRVQQPFGNHNGGQIGFNPLATPGDSDFGMLYVGVADGGSGGDPMNLSQNLGSAFGKILRIDPLGENSANGAYGIPADNPFAGDGDPDTLGEIFALGVRNPQRFAWDPETGALFVADIGQNTVEELSPVTTGANLGWNVWEGSFRYVGRDGVGISDPRSDPAMTYPVAEYDHRDGLMIGGTRAAVTGVHVYRSEAIAQLADLILFGDNPSGEVFFVSADDLPEGGASGIGRVLLNDEGEAKKLLQIVQEKNAEQGREPAGRVDLRFGSGPDGQVFLLNKQDGVIRLLVAPE
jgi:glucose/arabinose dehydrogenase